MSSNLIRRPDLLGLTREEEEFFRQYDDPFKVQDFLDSVEYNGGEVYTCKSPLTITKLALDAQHASGLPTAHCFEGALWGWTSLWLAGRESWLVNLAVENDGEHVILAYKDCEYWGSVSQSVTGVLRDHDPICKSLRELVLTYHRVYTNTNGEKSLRAYSTLYDPSVLGHSWITTPEQVGWIGDELDKLPHQPLFPPERKKRLRKASKKLLASIYNGVPLPNKLKNDK